MKTSAIKINWKVLDDIVSDYQSRITWENPKWNICQEIREICINAEPGAEIVIMESPF